MCYSMNYNSFNYNHRIMYRLVQLVKITDLKVDFVSRILTHFERANSYTKKNMDHSGERAVSHVIAHRDSLVVRVFTQIYSTLFHIKNVLLQYIRNFSEMVTEYFSPAHELSESLYESNTENILSTNSPESYVLNEDHFDNNDPNALIDRNVCFNLTKKRGEFDLAFRSAENILVNASFLASESSSDSNNKKNDLDSLSVNSNDIVAEEPFDKSFEKRPSIRYEIFKKTSFNVLPSLKILNVNHLKSVKSISSLGSQRSLAQKLSLLQNSFNDLYAIVDAPNDITDKEETVYSLIENTQKQDIILWAATAGDITALRFLLKKCNIKHEVDYLGRTALHLAIFNDNLETAEILLEAGLDPNAQDGFRHTPLYYAIITKQSFNMAQLLFNYGATITTRTTPTDLGIFLEFVAMATPTYTETLIMHLLLDKGAVVNDPDPPGGRQALHYAAMANNGKLIKALTDVGADLNATNTLNMTPKDVADFYGCKEAMFVLEDIAISRIVPDARTSDQLSWHSFSSEIIGDNASYHSHL